MAKIAKHNDVVTDELWETINPFNKKLVEEYLSNATHLSPKSKVTYSSSLRQYFYWIKENRSDKNCTEIKSKDYMFYQNSLSNRGLSESAVKTNRYSISAFNKYIMLYYEEEYPTFRNYVTSGIPIPKTGFVHKKEPLTPDEYNMLCVELEKREDWQKLAYVKFSYSTGCRRAEALQLLKEVVNYKPQKKIVKIVDEEGKTSEMESVAYRTHEIRCKGKSIVGDVRPLQFSEDVMDTLKKWLEVRGDDDCPYMFVKKYKNGECSQLSETAFNYWCSNIFKKIVGRRVNPHLMRSSRVTNMVLYENKSIETARRLLGHKDSSTTKIYLVSDEESDAFDAFV